MKYVLFLILMVLFSSSIPVDTEPFKLSFALIVAILVGCWEVIGRLIPSVGQITIIGKIIEIISWLSNFLNRKI